ncbi:MAG: SEC-C metal-binding domain-containing protein [Candidatus Ratteibacteria bacterium]|nr:SEC-C metal-binding domain-containing protein [Candidatus Ratteibacteria bacterium]
MEKEKIDPRAMEKMTSDLTRLLQNKTFDSENEMKVYLNGLIGKELPDVPPKDALSYAQDIIYDAWETESRKERIKMAREALSVSPDCADAYNLLAEEEAGTFEEAKKLYEKAVEAGERALGKKTFKESKGYFWGVLKTRPYMRARAGLAQSLWKSGDHEKAIAHYRDMLRLNPNDNQGIRYILSGCLARLKKYEELDKLLNKREYKNDCGIEWLYAQALLSFVKEGDSQNSRQYLNAAIKSNSYAVDYLVGRRRMPTVVSDTIAMHSEEEGAYYAVNFYEAWVEVSGVIKWLKKRVGIKAFVKVGRNELCPCGSGKKYKKCCGQ